MSDLLAVLVGLFPLVLTVGLVYFVLRTLLPHDQQHIPPPSSDDQRPRVRHIAPAETRPQWRRLVPPLQFTSQDGQKPPPRERSKRR
jgi:hypothetical protein